MNDDNVSDFDFLLAYSTRDAVHKLRRLSPAVDRVIQLRLSRDSRGTGTNWPAGRSEWGALEPNENNATAALAILCRYFDTNTYRPEIGHAITSVLFYGPAPVDNRVVAAFVLWFLTVADLPMLLIEQLRFIVSGYKPPAENVAPDEGKADPALPATPAELINVFKMDVSMLPLFRVLYQKMQWAYNCAAGLLQNALASSSYESAIILFQTPAFSICLPLAAFDAVQRSCATQLLEVRAQQLSAPMAATGEIESSERAAQLGRYVKNSIVQPVDQMLSGLAKLKRRSELLQEKEEALVEKEPEVVIDRAKNAVFVAKQHKREVEECLLSIRNTIARGSPAKEGYIPYLVDSLGPPAGNSGRFGQVATNDVLCDHSKEKRKDDDDDEDDDDGDKKKEQQVPKDIQRPLAIGAEVLKYLVQGNSLPPVAGQMTSAWCRTWAQVGVFQALYRYYELDVLPEVVRAQDHLNAEHAEMILKKHISAQKSADELRAKIQAYSYLDLEKD